MTKRDLVIVAAAAAFSLAGVASVNTSEAINVVLPSQYRTVWDQSIQDPDAAQPAGPEARLSVDRPVHGVLGPFARNVTRHWPDRG